MATGVQYVQVRLVLFMRFSGCVLLNQVRRSLVSTRRKDPICVLVEHQDNECDIHIFYSFKSLMLRKGLQTWTLLNLLFATIILYFQTEL